MENDEIKTGKGMTLKKFVEEILAERIWVDTGGTLDDGSMWDGATNATKDFTDEQIATEAGAQDVKGARKMKLDDLIKQVAAIRKTLDILKLGKKK